MANPQGSQYGQLRPRAVIRPARRVRTQEMELDALLNRLNVQAPEPIAPTGSAAETEDLVEKARQLFAGELTQTLEEMSSKYAAKGITITMDAQPFLNGGREMKIEMSFGPHSCQLIGTITQDAIAFQEIRRSPCVNGELMSGPRLRLRALTKQVFRDFICERLTVLIRTASRQRGT